MKLEDIAGSVETDAGQAVTFLKRWYKAEDLITYVGIREKRPNRPHLMAHTCTAEELWSALEDDPEFINQLVRDEDSHWNLYVVVNPVKAHVANVFKRGGDENVATFRGVWVDLDVKPGSFENEEAALQFLRQLEVWPTMVVLTGSGGVHAYWKFSDDETPGNGKDVSRAWWSHLSERAEAMDVKVDRLVDSSRMMRLPGSVRWPKRDEVIPPQSVTLHYSGGDDVPAARLSEVSRAADERRVERINRTVNADRQRTWDRKMIERSLQGDNQWTRLQLISHIDDAFNEEVTWDEVLEPSGWTYLRTDHSERREWARPGRDEKSATTDWPDSPHVMSLLSSSDDTGMLDLKEAEIPLTKYRVALRLWFNDDETKMIEWTLSRLKK